MLILFPIYILHMTRLAKKYDKIPVVVFLLFGIILSIITPLLNYENPVQYSDISDAATYITFAEDLNVKSIVSVIPATIGWQYVSYILLLRLLFIFSLRNRFLFVSSTFLLNFFAFSITLLFLQRFISEIIHKQVNSFDIKWWMLALNPGFILLSISTTRDSLISLSLTGAWFYANMFAEKRDKKYVLKCLFFVLFLMLFRAVYVAIFVSGIFIIVLIRKFRIVKNVPLVMFLSAFIVFFVLVLILPSNILESIFLPAGIESVIDERFAENLRGLILSKTSKISLVKAYINLFVMRLFPNLIGRSHLYDLYYYLTVQQSEFYYSNVIKAIFMFLYNFYRYILVLPIITNIFIAKKRYDSLDFLLWFYLFTLILYTAKFGGFQPRIRVVIEVLMVSSVFVYSKLYVKFLPVFFLFAIFLGIAELIYRIYGL